MSSQTSLVAKSCRLQQWAVQINECQNRPKAMTVDEWCDQHAITKATYYYRLKCVRQAYLDSAETPVTEFVEMPIPTDYYTWSQTAVFCHCCYSFWKTVTLEEI